MATVYRNGVVHSFTHPHAQALLVADGRIGWLGDDDDVDSLDADEVVDVEGALITPGFVDAHVHLLETGLALTGLDLSGARSLAEVLDAVAAAAADAQAGGDALRGHGWDESSWPEARPPSRQELDRAAGGRPVYLARVDLHSATISTVLAVGSECREEAGWRDDGVVTGEAHERSRAAIREVGDIRRTELYHRALGAAAAQGVVSVHEHSAPVLDTREGLRSLLELSREPTSGLPGVIGYRAELCETVRDARTLLAAIPGLTGIGGDLTVDGSIGSRSAAVRAPYVDGGGHGELRISAEQVANHVSAVTGAGVQAAFHVIGDRAMDEVLLGLQTAGDVEGIEVIRSGGHRIEHAEMVDARALAHLLLFGLTVSAQPAFDAAWGGADGMYARRLGAVRSAGLNPLADLAAAGIPLVFGSDSPVTPIDPWAAIRAAVSHHEPAQRISTTAAFRAHTWEGWRAVRRERSGAGEIRVGAPASFAVWSTDGLAAAEPRLHVAARVNDAPLLPELGTGELPRCRRTVRDGVVIFDG